MVAQIKKYYITPQEYLERERKATSKSEYCDGDIVAMAGASEEHNTITFNLVTELGAQLKGKDCRGYANDMRVRVPQCSRYYYPDVSVVCGDRRFEDAEVDTLLNPTLIIETLSRSTERIDREEKYDCYRTLPSLMTYVLVAQDRTRIETFTRQADHTWRHDVANQMEAVMPLLAIACALRLSDVYAGVTFPPPPSALSAENVSIEA